MCITVPMQVLAVDGAAAVCAARGTQRRVGLLFLGDGAVAAGDWVLVAGNQVTQRVDAEEARATWDLLDEILAVGGGGEEAAVPG